MRTFHFASFVLLVLAVAASASGQQILIDGVEKGFWETIQFDDLNSSYDRFVHAIPSGETVGTAEVIGHERRVGNEDDGWWTHWESIIWNYGTVNTVTVNSGHFSNQALVNTAKVNSGYFDNCGEVNTATVNDGNFVNRSQVNTVTVNGGRFDNQAFVNTAEINGKDFYNDGTINTATVNSGGSFWNYGTVNTATVNDGSFTNHYGNSMVNTATVDGGSFGNGGAVNTATVNGGSFGNFVGSGMVNTATVNDGSFSNGYWVNTAAVNGGNFNNYGGTVNTATLNGGTFYNFGGGMVNTATLNGGTFYNGQGISDYIFGYGTSVGSAIVNGGTLINYDENTITKITISGGTINNSGEIKHTAISGGTLSNSDSGWIQTVSLGGNGYAHNNGEITSIDVKGTATLENNYAGEIYDVTVSEQGFVNNGGTVNQITAKDASEISNTGLIKRAALSGDSRTVNASDASGGGIVVIESVTLKDNSRLFNGTSSRRGVFAGQIGTITVSDNSSLNNVAGGIFDLTLKGQGSVYNESQVQTATLLGGFYAGTGQTENVRVGKGGTFDTGLYTGSIGNLVFEQDGVLLIKGTSFADFNQANVFGTVDLTGAAIRFSFEPATSSFAAAPLAFGALALEAEPLLFASAAAPALTFASELTFDLASLFNFVGDDAGFATENWWEGIASVEVAQGIEVFELTALGDGWFGLQESGGNETPEPATLLILGLGIIGLGLARRKRNN